VDDRVADLLPDPLDDPHLVQDRGRGHREPAGIPVLRLDAGKLRRGHGSFELRAIPWNSIIIAGGSTLLGIIIAVPAAWSMAFVPSRRTKDILLWMLSTKMLPAVGVLYPIYLLCIQLGVLDNRFALLSS
jgi:ABC-type Fe3+ transport system permease subunit